MQNLNRHHLNGLRAVEAAARLGSLSAAAEELAVTVGAVSQQVARAEAALGLALLVRSRRGTEPTEAGAAVCALLSEGFGRISAAVARAEARRTGGLTISVAPILAARWLIWQLPGFSAAHPGLKVRLDADLKLTVPGRDDVDYAIRVGKGPWPGVKAEHLFDQLIVPVCSPAVAQHLATPAALAGVPVIREPTPGYAWDDWLGPEGLSEDILGDGPVFSDASLCLDAAVAGLGVFLAFEVVAAHALAQGSVVAPFPRWRQSGHGYWLISAPDQAPTPNQAAFRRWLTGRIAEEGFGQGGAHT